MPERPIMFSAPMVKAVLAGRKTQTRRLTTSPLAKAQPGDHLWVRENWRTLHKWDCLKPSQLIDDRSNVTYEADPENRNPLWAFGKLRPSIFMPRWASRITLTVKAVRIEKLDQISRDDAEAEGIDGEPFHWRDYLDPIREFSSPLSSYRSLWASLHGIESWHANPDVLVLTFVMESSAE